MFTYTLALASALCWVLYAGLYKRLQLNITAVAAAVAAVAFHGGSLLASKPPIVLFLATVLSKQQGNAMACLHLAYGCFKCTHPSIATICAAFAHFIAAWNLLTMQVKQAIYSASLEALSINTYRYIKLVQNGKLEEMQASSQQSTRIQYQWDPDQKFSLIKAIIGVHWQRIAVVSAGLVMLKLIPYYQQFTLLQLLHGSSELYTVALRWIALHVVEVLLLHVQEEKNDIINTIVDSVRMDVYVSACKAKHGQIPFDIDTALMHVSNFRDVLYTASNVLTNVSTQFVSILFIAAKLGWSTAAVIFMAALFSMFVSSLKFKSKHGSMQKATITPQVIIDNLRTIKQYAWESKMYKLVDYNSIPTLPRLHLIINGVLDRIATYGPKVVTSLAVLYSVDELSYAELSILLYNTSKLSSYMENFQHIPTAIAQYMEFENYIKMPLQSAKHSYIEHKLDGPSGTIVLDNCSFSWGSFTLQSLSLKVEQGSFVTVEGKVGGGKSSLMAALCGEMPLVGGSGTIYGKISYVGQKPWIMNATFRDNILFGSEFDELKYQQIIYACALYEDIQRLPFKDMSEIGRKGVNLSGGQKARLALARAIYNDADVYVLDDVLSAVDIKVERHLIDQVLSGILKDKTRVLVTHAQHVMRLSDMRLLVDNGKVTINHTMPVITKNKQIDKHKREIVEDSTPAGNFNIYLENNNSSFEIIWKFISLSGFGIVAITMAIQFAHSLVQAHISSIKFNLPNNSSRVVVANIKHFIKMDLLFYFLANELQSQAHMVEFFWAQIAVVNMQKRLMQRLLYSKLTFTEKLSKSAVSGLFSDIIAPALMAKYGLVEIASCIFNAAAFVVKQPFETLLVLCILVLPVYFYRKLKTLQVSIVRKSNQCGLKNLAKCNDMEDEIMDGCDVLRIHGRLDMFVDKLLKMSSFTVMINKQSHLLEISLMAVNQLIQMSLSLAILVFIKWRYATLSTGYIEQTIKLAIALYDVFKLPATANIEYSLPKLGQYLSYVEGIEQELSHSADV